jgi:ATP-dependent Lon protease
MRKGQLSGRTGKAHGGNRSRLSEPQLPLLPVREMVVFPYTVAPIFIGREASLRAVENAVKHGRQLVLVAQRQANVEDPEPADMYHIGTVVSILRMLKLPDGRVKLLVQGQCKIRIRAYNQLQPYLRVHYEPLEDLPEASTEPVEMQALLQMTRQQLEHLLTMGRLIPPDLLILADNYKSPGRLADLIVANIGVKFVEAQQLLEVRDPLQRLRRVGELLTTELDMMTMQHNIQSRAREEMGKTQREYFLREQLKLIHKELGDGDDPASELLELRERIERSDMPTEVAQETRKQLSRLERLHPEAAEASMVRSYLEWLVELPWTTTTADLLDLREARRVLDEDHYGLHQVKERILEHLGVGKLKADLKGPILCFVGPPGVGKTSLGRSIARALGRRFVRLSLGGIRDEAEIRGHRRTYVGALPGRIVQSMRQAGAANPVFMLDEVDKIGMDARGDPAAALLEVLDPEQNHNFSDHYLGVPFDLSRVMFIATANVPDPIPPALRDRMEIIRIPGYTEEEKCHIARRYLVPRQLREHGLRPQHLRLSETTIRQIITAYTREAGLRNLERELATLCRKVARRVAEGQTTASLIHLGNLQRYLGVRKYLPEAEQQHDEVGIATGLAWTEVGGEIMRIEATAMEGKGQLILTGQLGEVIKESAQAALSYIRARAPELHVPSQLFQERDLHIHVPAGAIPKDGPSAGIAMATALVSVLTGVPIPHTLAMSGEITLRGHVLAVGGIKEKVLAAKRAGIQHLILPQGNHPDFEELPATVRRNVHLHFVHTMDEVLGLAHLSPAAKERQPEPS